MTPLSHKEKFAMNQQIRDARVGEETPESKVMAAIYAILSLPRPERTGALVIWPGFERKRVFETAANLWRHERSTKLWVAAQNPKESGGKEMYLTKESLADRFGIMNGPEREIVIQGEGENTKVQADWLAGMIILNPPQSITLVAPGFHMTRAVMTILASLRNTGAPQVRIYPHPTEMDPAEIIPIPGACQWDFAKKEGERIIAYQAKGDVCSFDELRMHLTQTWAYHVS